jgi:hypothetical protein
MLVRMLLALRSQRRRSERGKVCAWHCEIGYLEAGIVRRYGGGD